jgi:hypothetical protein
MKGVCRKVGCCSSVRQIASCARSSSMTLCMHDAL